MDNSKAYHVQLKNRRAFRRHLKRLIRESGHNNVSLEDALNFDFEWILKRGIF